MQLSRGGAAAFYSPAAPLAGNKSHLAAGSGHSFRSNCTSVEPLLAAISRFPVHQRSTQIASGKAATAVRSRTSRRPLVPPNGVLLERLSTLTI
jgi:hypothetical protein